MIPILISTVRVLGSLLKFDPETGLEPISFSTFLGRYTAGLPCTTFGQTNDRPSVALEPHFSGFSKIVEICQIRTVSVRECFQFATDTKFVTFSDTPFRNPLEDV